MKVVVYVKSILKDNRQFLLFMALMLIFRSCFADWNHVPTGSMKPTILEGDRIWVDKMAYDIRLPFSHISIAKMSEPERGDVIVFDSQVSDKRLVKRVIATPGDRVAMHDNTLVLNGAAVDYQSTPSGIEREQIDGKSYRVKRAGALNQLSSFGEVVVPDGYYLVLGDNRNNSADSRVIGFVPRSEIVGRTDRIVASLDPQNSYLPREERFWSELD